MCNSISYSQTLTFEQISDSIKKNNPMLKMYDAQGTAYQSYAEGAKSWMPPQVGAGFFMTPYNTAMWKGDKMGNNGMGSVMLQGEQMIPNYSKLNAEKNYMQSMSNMEVANKGITLNQLLFEAKTNFYQWQILLRKVLIV
ncbi:MAG: TolC family protein [Bacteroidetes bacterium]|nr:TolC family protein [Bacteroidota bacterium]